MMEKCRRTRPDLKNRNRYTPFCKKYETSRNEGQSKNEFKATDFVSKEYVKELENHNIKLEYALD